MSWDEYTDDPATHVQMIRHAESLNEHSKKSRHHQVKILLRDIVTGPSGLVILQSMAYQFRMMICKGTNPDMATMPNLYQLWHWGYIKIRSVNEELWIFTRNFADPQTMARMEQTCVHFHRIWASQVMPSTAGLVPVLPTTQDLCVVVHNTNPPFHRPMASKYNTISGIMTSQAVSNIVFRKVHADVQLHRTWPSVDSAAQSDREDSTFLLPDDWPTNIWTDTLQKLTTTSPWTPPAESDIRTKLTVDHIFHDVLPHMIWTPRFALPLTPQQLHAIQMSSMDPLIFTFADPCHALHGQDTRQSSQPHLTEKFYKIDNEGHVPMPRTTHPTAGMARTHQPPPTNGTHPPDHIPLRQNTQPSPSPAQHEAHTDVDLDGIHLSGIDAPSYHPSPISDAPTPKPNPAPQLFESPNTRQNKALLDLAKTFDDDELIQSLSEIAPKAEKSEALKMDKIKQVHEFTSSLTRYAAPSATSWINTLKLSGPRLQAQKDIATRLTVFAEANPKSEAYQAMVKAWSLPKLSNTAGTAAVAIVVAGLAAYLH